MKTDDLIAKLSDMLAEMCFCKSKHCGRCGFTEDIKCINENIRKDIFKIIASIEQQLAGQKPKSAESKEQIIDRIFSEALGAEETMKLPLITFELIQDCMEQFASQKLDIREELINKLRGISENTPELNMCNYSHDQVRQLNDSNIEIYLLIDEYLKQ